MDELDLDPYTLCILREAGYITIGDLTNATGVEIFRLKGIGGVKFSRLVAELWSRGLHLKGKDDPTL